jgi:hypothetical protein
MVSIKEKDTCCVSPRVSMTHVANGIISNMEGHRGVTL